jgi:hypothetical protein
MYGLTKWQVDQTISRHNVHLNLTLGKACSQVIGWGFLRYSTWVYNSPVLDDGENVCQGKRLANRTVNNEVIFVTDVAVK